MPVPKILLTGDDRLAAFPQLRKSKPRGPAVVGWREWVSLPALGIAMVKAKIDTGARTSALHANSIEPFELDGQSWVRFDVIGEAENAPWHDAPILTRRLVRSSNGEAELRYVICTEIVLDGSPYPAEISLTNRERMELPMLVGREALAGRVLVDPQKSWLAGRPLWPARPARRAQRPRTATGDKP